MITCQFAALRKQTLSFRSLLIVFFGRSSVWVGKQHEVSVREASAATDPGQASVSNRVAS